MANITLTLPTKTKTIGKKLTVAEMRAACGIW